MPELNGLREKILRQDDLPREAVAIPEWKDDDGKPIVVWVRTMTGTERDAYEWWCIKQKGGELVGVRGRLVALCTVDEDGTRIFDDEKDPAKLGKKSAAALQRIFDAARKLNFLSQSDVDELEKNSESVPSDEPGSVSADTSA